MRALHLALVYALLSVAYGRPLEWLRKFSSETERRWLGGLFAQDSTVVVHERSPPLVFLARPALFGRELKEPLQGYAIPLSSFAEPCKDIDTLSARDANATSSTALPENLACQRLCQRGRHAPDPTDTWIALVQRGECDFVSKAREAQRLGAKGVVVGGSDSGPTGSDQLIHMFGTGNYSDVTIAATYIRFADYSTLMSLIHHSETTHSGIRTVSLSMSSEPAETGWYSPIVTFVTILLLPSLMTLATLIIHRIRAARAAQRERAPEDVVRNLPWQVWTGSGWEKHEGPVPEPESDSNANPAAHPEGLDRDIEAQVESASEDQPSSASQRPISIVDQPWFDQQHECAICLSEFVKGDRVRVLPCHHIFHLDEVDDWLIKRKKLCPVCKADVTRPGEPSSENENEESEQATTQAASPTERTPLLGERQSHVRS